MGSSALIPEIAEITDTTIDKWGFALLSQASNNQLINLPPRTLSLWTAKSHWRMMPVYILAVYEMPVTQSRLSCSTTRTSMEIFAACYLKGCAEESNG